MGFIHFQNPGSGGNGGVGWVGNGSCIELERGETLVEFVCHMIVEFLAGVGVWIYTKHPTYSCDVSGGDRVIA